MKNLFQKEKKPFDERITIFFFHLFCSLNDKLDVFYEICNRCLKT